MLSHFSHFQPVSRFRTFLAKCEMSVSARIKLLRQAMGLTQEAFAQRFGIPTRTLKGYEMGERQPGTDALASIARTGVNMTWMLTGEGDMHHPAPQQPTQNQADIPTQTGAVAPVTPPRIEALTDLIDTLPAPDRARLLQEFLARATDARQLAELRQAVAELRSRLPP